MNEIARFTLRDGIRRFAIETGFDQLLPDLDEGIEDCCMQLAALGLELRQADRRGLSLVEAVSDEFGYPNLFRLHMALEDMLTSALDPELECWARTVQQTPPLEFCKDLDRALARTAVDSNAASRATGTEPMLRDLSRFALYELTRMSLLLSDHKLGRDNIHSHGLISQDVNVLAEQETDACLAIANALPSAEVTPKTIFASAMIVVKKHASYLRQLVTSAERIQNWKTRASIEHQLRLLDRREDLLLRDALDLNDDRVSIERLIARHPVAFGETSPNSEYQRRHRATASLKTRADRGRVALVDLLLEEAQ